MVGNIHPKRILNSISFVRNNHVSCPIVLKLSTAYGSDTVVLWTKFQNGWGQVMGKRDITIFSFDVLWRISYRARPHIARYYSHVVCNPIFAMVIVTVPSVHPFPKRILWTLKLFSSVRIFMQSIITNNDWIIHVTWVLWGLCGCQVLCRPAGMDLLKAVLNLSKPVINLSPKSWFNLDHFIFWKTFNDGTNIFFCTSA